MMIIRCAC